MINHFGCVEILRIVKCIFPICSLICSFSFIVTFPMHLSSSNIQNFVQVETSWYDTKHVNDSVEIVEVTIDTICNACVLHFNGDFHVVCQGCFMNLSDTCCSKWIQIDFIEMIFPCTSIFTNEILLYLLKWHDVSFRSCLFHSISNNRWKNWFFTCTQQLSNFQSSSSHFLEIVCETISILLV